MPAAIAGCGAYLGNKYGNGYAVQLSRQEDPLTRLVRKKAATGADRRSPAPLLRGHVFVAEIGGA